MCKGWEWGGDAVTMATAAAGIFFLGGVVGWEGGWDLAGQVCLCGPWGQGAVTCRTQAGCVLDGAEVEDEGGVIPFWVLASQEINCPLGDGDYFHPCKCRGVALRPSEPRQSWRTETQNIASMGVLQREKDPGVGRRTCLARWAFSHHFPTLPRPQEMPLLSSPVAPLPHRLFPASTRGHPATTGTQEYPLGYLVCLGWGRHWMDWQGGSPSFWAVLACSKHGVGLELTVRLVLLLDQRLPWRPAMPGQGLRKSGFP